MRKILTLILFFCAPLFADENTTEIITSEAESYNFMGEFIQMILTLGFVIVLIFVTVWFLKKIMRSRIHTLNKTNAIKILERRPLNPKSSLYLIDILGKAIVVADSPAGVQLITELAADVNAEELLENLQGEEKPRLSFKDTFANSLKKLTSKQ